MSRHLTKEETRVLGLIQAYYGSQNSADGITWVNAGEAVLWITDNAGAAVLMANLTNLANWRLDGTISNDEELTRDWLQIKNT